MSASALRGRALAVYVFCCAIWGSTWLVIRLGVRDLPPLTFAAIRMGLACAILTTIALRRARSRPAGGKWRRIAWAGFLQIGVSYAAIFLAARRIESGLSAVLFSSFPIWVGLFAHFALPDERLTARTIAAAVVGLAGVAVIEGPAAVRAVGGGEAGPLLTGGLLVLVSAVSAAWANVYLKKHLSDIDPAVNVWGETLAGSLFLAALALLFERGEPAHWTPAAIAALAYLAIPGTVLTFVALFWLVPRVPVSVIGTIPLVDTVVAVALGAVVLGEALPLRVLGGAALILVGVVLAAHPSSPAGEATMADR